MIVKEVRLNTDIKWIVIHHTTNIDGRNGTDVNSNYKNSGYFGIPYDIIINMDGTVDLAPRWTYSSNAADIIKNAKITDISGYPRHYLSGIGETYDYNKYAVHVALTGNFDITVPLSAQINTLIKVLNQLIFAYKIDPRMYLYYHSTITNTSCPGINMISRASLLSMLTIQIIPDFIVQMYGMDTVIDPLFLNFTGNNVTVTLNGDTATVTYIFGNYPPLPPPPVPPIPPGPPVIIYDDSMDVTVDAVAC